MEGTVSKPCASIYWLEKLKKIRRRAYIFVIVVGLIGIYYPYIAHADLFAFEIQDVYAEITENVLETNAILTDAFTFCQTSPYDVVNGISGTGTGTIATAVIDASKYMSLIVAVLLLMVEFFRKSINYEWSSKWENVLIFLVKIIVIKQVVQNADVIVGYIYAGFNYINTQAISKITEGDVSISFLPCDSVLPYVWTDDDGVVTMMIKKGWWNFWKDVGAGEMHKTYTYLISENAVKMFYPNAALPEDLNLNDNPLSNPTTKVQFMPTIENFKLQPYFLMMKGIAYFIFVIAAGRVFELSIYTMFAPLPLATFASETSHDVAKAFIKNYIAVVLQVAVIVVMFVAYVALNKYVVENFASTKLIQYVVLISLGLGVMKSGSWAKKICGMG